MTRFARPNRQPGDFVWQSDGRPLTTSGRVESLSRLDKQLPFDPPAPDKPSALQTAGTIAAGAALLAAAAVLQPVVKFLTIPVLLFGLYLGGKILSLGLDAVPRSARRAAMAGVALSGGTILLIVAMAVASSL